MVECWSRADKFSSLSFCPDAVAHEQHLHSSPAKTFAPGYAGAHSRKDYNLYAHPGTCDNRTTRGSPVRNSDGEYMATVKTTKVGLFPSAKLKAAMDDWWDDEKELAEALSTNVPLPAGKTAMAETSVMRRIIEIDSHRAVRVLIVLEPILGLPLPETLIQEGGYETYEDMVKHLLSEIRKVWQDASV